MNLPLTHLWQPAPRPSKDLMVVLHGRGDSVEGFDWLQEDLEILSRVRLERREEVGHALPIGDLHQLRLVLFLARIGQRDGGRSGRSEPDRAAIRRVHQIRLCDEDLHDAFI